MVGVKGSFLRTVEGVDKEGVRSTHGNTKTRGIVDKKEKMSLMGEWENVQVGNGAVSLLRDRKVDHPGSKERSG